MADAGDLKSPGGNLMRVRSPLPVPTDRDYPFLKSGCVAVLWLLAASSGADENDPQREGEEHAGVSQH